MNRKFHTVGAAVSAATLMLGLAACGSASGNGAGGSGDNEQSNVLKVRGDVYYTGAQLAMIVGVQQGIFAKHDLQVELNPGTGSATTIQTVNNGSDDIGYADAGTMVQSIGQGLKVKMIGGMVQETPMALFAFQDSGIQKASDLKGRTAGYTAGSAAERLFPAYASSTGVDQKSVTFKNVDVPTRDNLFMSRKTDFTFGLVNTSEPNIEARCKCEVTVLKYSDAGINVLSSGIVANEKLLQERPEVVKRFLVGLQESVEWTNANLDEAVKAFFTFAKDSKLAPEVVAAQWQASWDLHETPNNTGQAFGCTSAADWDSTIKAMEQFGGLDAGKLTADKVATNAFLPQSCTDLTQ